MVASSDSDEDDAEEMMAPKVLGDILESIAGAVFIDSGMNLQRVWEVFQPHFQPLIGKVNALCSTMIALSITVCCGCNNVCNLSAFITVVTHAYYYCLCHTLECLPVSLPTEKYSNHLPLTPIEQLFQEEPGTKFE